MTTLSQGATPRAAQPNYQSATVAGAAITISTAGLLTLGVQPILLGSLASLGRLSEAGVGQVATAEILCLAVGGFLSPGFMNRGGMRLKSLIAALLLVVIDASIGAAGSLGQILLQRAFAGFLAGMLLGPGIVILTHSRHPERMNGILLGASLAPQIAAAYLIPTLVAPRFGPYGGFVILAVAAAVAAVAALFIVDRVPAEQQPTFRSVRWSPRLAALVGAVFLQNMGLGAGWSYVERLNDLDRFPATIAGLAVAASLGLQIFGSFGAAFFAHRAPARLVLAGGALIQTLATVLMVVAHTPPLFIFASCAFGLFWPTLQPFQVGEIIRLDASRRIAMLVGPIVLLGNALGPLAASIVIASSGVRAGYGAATVMLGLSTLVYAVLCLRSPGSSWAQVRP